MTDADEFTKIPYDKLSKEALQGIIEEFINREGTDYGLIEASFTDKCDQVLAQIKRGDVLVVFVFDHGSQSVGVMHKDQLI